MAKGKGKGKGKGGERNSNRPNGKAAKKNPGVAPGAHNGKSVGGYSKRGTANR